MTRTLWEGGASSGSGSDTRSCGLYELFRGLCLRIRDRFIAGVSGGGDGDGQECSGLENGSSMWVWSEPVRDKVILPLLPFRYYFEAIFLPPQYK